MQLLVVREAGSYPGDGLDLFRVGGCSLAGDGVPQVLQLGPAVLAFFLVEPQFRFPQSLQYLSEVLVVLLEDAPEHNNVVQIGECPRLQPKSDDLKQEALEGGRRGVQSEPGIGKGPSPGP